ncbi:hypothetical protein IAR55_002694 [Kwoniella newhampshirensis]|uniref:Uncharacterized protein n=1 Tax=Kwoniella newhampshirensis TaxID=1651941 RepID=A0AAW0YZX1_9TREE
MNAPASLSTLSDPISLGKVQILLVPVHLPGSPIPSSIYDAYLTLIKRHQTLRGDELLHPSPPRSRSHSGSSVNDASSSRKRFFALHSGGSMSMSRGASSNHVHLSFTGNGPAKHIYPLSLLRMSAFPLIVLGIAIDSSEAASADDGERIQPKGCSLNEADEEGEQEENGDIGEASTPTIPKFRHHQLPNKETKPSPGQAFEETVQNVFPATSPFPLVKRLLVIPDHLSHSSASPRKQANGIANGGKGRDKGEMRYSPADGVESWVGRILSEVVGELLAELGEIATALETPAGMRTLSSTLLPSLTSTLPHPDLDNVIASNRSSTPSDYPSRPGSSTTPISHPHSTSEDGLSGMGISLTRALTPGGRPTSVGPPSLPPIQTAAIAPAPQPIQPASSNPFRRSTAISSPFSRTTSAASVGSSTSNSPVQTTNNVTKYTSANLTGVAGGRLLKLLGDMYLLAGMYGDAIKCFDDGAERCRNVGDVLWEAAAREGRAVAGIGEAWEGRDGSNMAQPFPTSPIPVEILSHFLSALACLSRAPLPFPPSILSPSPQAVSGSISFSGPSTSNPSSVGTGEGLLAYLHTGLSLRISHFVLMIWASGGWGSIALSALMNHTLPRSFPPILQGHGARDSTARRRHARTLGLLSAQSGISRHYIFAHAEHAMGPHHRAMTKVEQLTIFNEIVWLSRWLGMPRKEAAHTRDVVKQLAVIVVEGREETRRLGAGGFPSKSRSPISAISAENRSDEAAAAVGLGLGIPVQAQAVAVRGRESTEGNSGIVALFEKACEIMGIDLVLPTHPPESVLRSTSADNDESGSSSTAPKFGWPELQVEMIKEGIAVMESLPDHPSIIRLCLSALHSLTGYLNPQSQGVLAKLYPAALATIRRRGLEFEGIPWWVPGRLVLSLEIASLPPNKLPIEHSREEIVVQEGKKDPFLYNPRLKAAEAGKTSMVANEQVDVFVTVRNPFTFDLDIQDLSILTSGVPFTTSPLPLTLPAFSVQTVRVTGTAPTAGLMQVRGVSIRLTDGSHTDFLLPVGDAEDRLRRNKRNSKMKHEVSKVKRTGLEARFAAFSIAENKSRNGLLADGVDVKEKWLECEVVEDLPLAWIKRTSLTHETVMLYNGETSIVKITLENSSSVPIDFLKLTFDDSTAREAHAIIQEGELTPEQAYELEWDQLHRPVFTWEKGAEEVMVPPGGRATISVRCLGKVGCSDGTIRIDYGCLNRPTRASNEEDNQPSPSGSQAFYTRQITFPVLFTVYHTIECHSLDLIRFEQSSSNSLEDSSGASQTGRPNGTLHHSTSSSALAEEQLRRALEEESDANHCLLSLNVKNVYGVPFEVTLGRKGDDIESTALTCTRLVPPGATERMILPIPRWVIAQGILSEPVPSLSERQYIVDKERKSAVQVLSEREKFWYREELLSLIHATWVEPGSLRRGTLSLRDQYLTPGLMEVFRSDGVEVRVEISPRMGGGAGKVQMMEFVDLKVVVMNQLAKPLRPYVHLEPLPSSPHDQSWTQASFSSTSDPTSARRPQSVTAPHHHGNKNVLLDGVSSGLMAPLNSGERGEWKMGAMFLASGQFGLRAAVEQVSEQKKAGEDGEQRGKVWFSSVLHVDVLGME